MIKEVISDFNFRSPVDRSIALAALLMPGLRLGPLMQSCNPFPIVLVESDASQAGKSYFSNVVGKLYGLKLGYVPQKRGGVGSFDESLQSCLLKETALVVFDNLRDKIDSEFLEMAITSTAPITARAMRSEGSVDMRSKLLEVARVTEPRTPIFKQGWVLAPDGCCLANLVCFLWQCFLRFAAYSPGA
jgi:hypothetical protein